MDKLSEGWGRKKWNSRYFVLEAHWLKYHQDDEKIGDSTNIDMKQVQNVTILSNHQSKENVLAVSIAFNHILAHNFPENFPKLLDCLRSLNLPVLKSDFLAYNNR